MKLFTPEVVAERLTPELIEEALRLARIKTGPDVRPVSNLSVFDHRSFNYWGKNRLVFSYNDGERSSHVVIIPVDWE